MMLSGIRSQCSTIPASLSCFCTSCGRLALLSSVDQGVWVLNGQRLLTRSNAASYVKTAITSTMPSTHWKWSRVLATCIASAFDSPLLRTHVEADALWVCVIYNSLFILFTLVNTMANSSCSCASAFVWQPTVYFVQSAAGAPTILSLCAGGDPGEEDPFKATAKEDAEADTVFAGQNTGIDFDAYEDIPVETSGKDCPAPIDSFEGINFPEGLLKNVRRCKYSKPTPVQRYSIPIGQAGRDLMACAQTGSGKTAAFCFPIIANILTSGLQPIREPRKAYPLALVLSPTRELSTQIFQESRKFAYETGVRPVVVYGGAPVGEQLRKLEQGCDILVATPGRLVDLIDRRRVCLSAVRI